MVDTKLLDLAAEELGRFPPTMYSVVRQLKRVKSNVETDWGGQKVACVCALLAYNSGNPLKLAVKKTSDT